MKFDNTTKVLIILILLSIIAVIYIMSDRSGKVEDIHSQCMETAFIEIEEKMTPVAKCYVSSFLGIISDIVYIRYSKKYETEVLERRKKALEEHHAN